MTIVEEFEAARVEASNAALYTTENVPPKTCRYCGRHWMKWPGSALDGHAKCIVPVSFQKRLLAYGATTRTEQALAAELGITHSVLRSWVSPRRITPITGQR